MIDGVSGYLFERRWGPEDERLAALERQLDPVTQAVIRERGLTTGWRCWEVGCGRGSVACWLADAVGSGGTVWATDLDPAVPAVHPPNLTVAVHDLTRDPVRADEFDLVHARHVLEHLADPAAAVAVLAGAVRPGGWLVVADADGLSFETEPATGELPGLAAPWEAAAARAGWDSRLGRRLASLLSGAGMTEVAGRSHRSIATGGDSWLVAQFGLQRMQQPLLDCGASAAQLQAAATALADPNTLVIGAPIVSAWGRRPT